MQNYKQQNSNTMTKISKPIQALSVFIFFSLSFLVGATPVHATSIAITGTAKVVNTSVYLDFDSYSSNVAVDTSSGNFSGYAWLEDLGWVAFGTTDNTEGPVTMSMTSGAVTGKAEVVSTGAFLDFTNYSSNVSAVLSTGVFSGHVWSEDIGWIDFTDTGVSSASPLVTPTPTSAPSSSSNPAPTLPPEIANRLSNGQDANGECLAQKPGGMPEIFRIDMTDTKATLFIAPPSKPYTQFFISYKEVGSIARGDNSSLGSMLYALGSLLDHPVYADSPEYAIDFSHADDGGVVEYTINDLKPNTRYEFKVKCANKCASTNYGDTVAATTQVLGVTSKKIYSTTDGSIEPTSGGSASALLASAGSPVGISIVTGFLLLISGLGVYLVKPHQQLKPIYTHARPKRLQFRA